MNINTKTLQYELRSTLATINEQIMELKKDVESRINLGGPLTWLQVQDRQGNYLAAPLLVAKANCLSALAALQEKK